MIDTHTHLNFKAFEKDCAQALRRSFDNGVEAVINVGSDYKTSKRAAEIAMETEGAYAAVGLHPIHAMDEEFDMEKYRGLAKAGKVVAIGETGLDYFHLPKERQEEFLALQEEVFEKHISLAKELDLPLIMHCRGSKEDPKGVYGRMLEILKQNSGLSGVIHCFSADWEIAQKFLDMGFYTGLTGIITFPKSEALAEVVGKAPLDRVLVETDAPYLSPEPYRGQRNEPWHVKFVIEKIAAIRGLEAIEVENQTAENARRLFKIR